MSASLDLYRVFNAVAEAGSFSAAAQSLYISQPAISQSIKQLEGELGVSLFVRSQRGAALTAEGRVLYGYTNSALGMIDSGEKRIKELSTLDRGILRIGASDTVSKWFLLPVMEEFSRRYPGVSLKITNRTSPETLALLREGRIDIGFVNMPISEPGVIFEECRRVHDVFIAGSKFSELRGKTLSLREIADRPLIMLERSSNTRRWIDRHFLDNGIPLSPEIELGAHSILFDYAEIGLGIACVIDEFSSIPEDGEIFKLDVVPPVPERSIAACYLEKITPTAAAKRFIELVKNP